MGDKWEQYAEPAPDKWAKYAEPPQTLAQRVRAKYPGAYDDIDDATLTKKVLAKYPQYSDLAAPIDYAALAKQAGAISSQPAAVDYEALAKEAGAISSQPMTQLAVSHEPPPPSTGQQIANVVGGMAKGIYDVSAPGIAASIAQKYRPNLTAKLPSWLQPAPLEEVPGNVVVQGGLTLLGAEEARPALAAAVDAARIVHPTPVEGAGPSLLSRLPRIALRHTPVVGKYVRAYDAARTAADLIQKFQQELPPEAAPPPVPPGFTLDKTGNVTPQGPPELWGRPAPIQARAAAPLPAPSPLTPVQQDVASAFKNQGYTDHAAEYWARQSNSADFDAAFRESMAAAKPPKVTTPLAPSHEVAQPTPLAVSHEPSPAYPPEAPTRPVEPTRMNYRQLQEDQGLAQQIREAAESEDRVRLMDNIRQWVGRNNPGTDKGVMAEEFAGRPFSIKEAVDHLEGIRQSDVQADELLKQLEHALQQGEAEPDFLGKVSNAQEAIVDYYAKRLRRGAAKRPMRGD